MPDKMGDQLMTKHQVLWASKHDWYVKAYRTSKDHNGYTVFVRPDGVTNKTEFTNFQALREWAGY